MRRAARLTQALAGSALFVAVILGVAAPAGAHADLVSSEPASGASLQKMPADVRLLFTEPVDPAFSRVVVRGTSGRDWPVDGITPDPTDNRALFVGMPSLGDGAYAVTWTTTTTDGHTATGDVVLAVGAGANVAALGPATPVGEGGWLRHTAEVARVLWYVALAALVGALLWDGHHQRAASAVRWLAAATVARALLLLAALQGASGASYGDVIARLRPTAQGRAWFVLVDVVLLSFIATRRRMWRAVIACAAVLVAADAYTGHASAAPHPLLEVGALSVHLGAMTVWLGGLLTLIRLPELNDVGPYLRRFSPVALASVGAVVVSGGVLALSEVGGWRGLTGSSYGHTLLVKIGLVSAVAALGLWHWRTGARAAMWITARLEIVAAIAVVAMASVLAALLPGRAAVARSVLAASTHPTTAKACQSASIETASCWEQYVTYVTNQRGVPAALTEIKQLSRRDHLVESECHQLTHTVGRTAFTKIGSAIDALKFTSPLCNSGYPHGVIEAAITALPPAELRKELPTFCAPDGRYRPYSFDHHNCAHGVGHGIATQEKEDVFASTPYCDVLSDPWEVQSCYGGVFMQKVIGDINGASSDAHADDPVWPCDVVPAIQKDACYMISTGRVLRMVNYDWPKAWNVCDNVEADFRTTCYRSMGRDISGYTNFEPKKMLDLCMQAGKLGPGDCLTGAVETTVDNDHGPTRAAALCALVPLDLKQQCQETLNDAVAEL